MTDTAGQRELDRLAEFGTLLQSCRIVFLALFEQGLHEPSTTQPSEAWADFRTLLAGPGGLWPADFVRQPRSTAVNLLHQQADYCSAMGVLVSVPEVRDPVAGLLRSVVEYGSRGFWLLDPEVGIRVRCIRAYLMELVSLYHSRPAYKVAPKGYARVAAKADGKARFRTAKVSVAQLFQTEGTSLADDPGQWTIEGHRYAGWTEITRAWAEACAPGLDGEALYELLAVRAHPQGFTATAGLTFDGDGQGTRVFTLEQVENQVRLAIASFHSALTLVADYHRQRQQLLADWEDEVLRVLPGVLTTSKAAEQPA
ncbi:hypothetical protein [Salinispora arenicola]|uniref:hypothetical protein n=1 Tax=Salinispora arenicola TaxID=168697 RepID=UPI0004816C5B|nr:hypothetical protein [Salinispora arenicola]